MGAVVSKNSEWMGAVVSKDQLAKSKERVEKSTYMIPISRECYYLPSERCRYRTDRHVYSKREFRTGYRK